MHRGECVARVKLFLLRQWTVSAKRISKVRRYSVKVDETYENARNKVQDKLRLLKIDGAR